MANGEALISLESVWKSYRTSAGDFHALRHCDLQIGDGEFVAILGKSGSGKSTFLNMITGIDRPTSGHVLVAGATLHAMGENRLAQWRGTTVGIVFQFFQLLPTLTVVENVMLPMDFCGTFAPGERRERSLSLLDRVNMREHADKLPTALSGGQQQRVAVVRALANDPPILVADEPTGNLDSETAESVFGLFEQLVTGGKTVLIVTHDADLADRATRIVTLTDGVLVPGHAS